MQDGVMELAIGHLVRVNEFVMQSTELERAHQIGTLVERPYRTIKRSAHFGQVVFRIETHIVDEEFHALLGSPPPKVKVHREDDSGGTVHAPAECTDPFRGRPLEALVVE